MYHLSCFNYQKMNVLSIENVQEEGKISNKKTEMIICIFRENKIFLLLC